MSTDAPRFRPDEIFRTLARHEVRYVVVGMLGATLHGSHLRTGDLDICPARDTRNLERLAAALREMGPRLRGPVDPLDPMGETSFPVNAGWLARIPRFLLLSTCFGDLDLVYEPDGTAGYEELAPGAVRYDLGEGLVVPVAALADIIRSKEAAGRPKDQEALPTLRALLERAARSPKP